MLVFIVIRRIDVEYMEAFRNVEYWIWLEGLIIGALKTCHI